MVLVDQFGLPLSIDDFTLAEATDRDDRLEEVLGRLLTFTEYSAAGSMGSEHASYGSSRFHLKTRLPVNGFNHPKALGDEAAAVVLGRNSFGEIIVAAYSSESHNSPSFVCAHPGAATGTGGNERDNIALTATRVDALFESRRQGHPLLNPAGDPIKQHTDETTIGIADYGNAMGIPHGDGSIKFHPEFAGNNLVNVACVSIAPLSRLMHNQVPTLDAPEKYVAIYIGKASDTTGVGGTKFASQAIDMTNQDLNEKAVQDPDPHMQEAVTRGIEKVVDLAIKEGWKDQMSLKDMGAAGLLCSTIEQLHGTLGVDLYGDLVPMHGERSSMELLEAETQERFFIYVHEDKAQKVLDVFNHEIGLPDINIAAQAKIIGRCNDSGRYRFMRSGKIDVDIPVADLTEGPLLSKTIYEPLEKPHSISVSRTASKKDIESVLRSLHFKSDAYVHDHYDKHIRSTHVVNRGEGAATLRTHGLLEGNVGYSMVFDSNSIYGLIDPKFQAEDSFYRGAWKLATMGCSVIGVTNNANYGRTDVPEEMWQFVEGQAGISNACRSWELEDRYVESISDILEVADKMEKDKRRHVTVNSGNCSLNKANANTGTAIPPTTILGLMGWNPDPEHYATWDLKNDESTLYLVGARQDSLDGSDFLQSTKGFDAIGNELFEHDRKTSYKEVSAIIEAVRGGYVAAANVIEEGGLVNAVSEMVANTSRDVSVTVDVNADMASHEVSQTGKLFSESYGMVMQVTKENEKVFLEHMKKKGVTAYAIGTSRGTLLGQGSLEFTEINKLDQHVVRNMYSVKLENVLRGVA